jgi:hypothetical protein
MADPSLALQAAIVTALKTAPAVAGGRVYDRIPGTTDLREPKPIFPFLHVGEGDTIGDDNPCFDSTECNVSVHVWSNAVGMPELKELAGLVRARLKTVSTVTGFRVTNADYIITRYMNDPDSTLTHAVVEFRYLIDHEYN